MGPFFDAHGHLQDPRCGDPAALLDGARAAGVEALVCCGTCEGDWEAVLALSAAHPEVVPMLGLHPWRVAEAGPDWAGRLEALLAANRAGVGECGLDFFDKGADRAAQEAALRIQLRLARRLGRPVALHAVKGWDRLLAILDEEGVPGAGAALGVMVHGFGGSPDMARELAARGVLLSFSAAALDPRRKRARASLAAVPPEFLLLESDVPDGEAPSSLPGLAAAAARLRGEDPAGLARYSRDNARRVFREVLR